MQIVGAINCSICHQHVISCLDKLEVFVWLWISEKSWSMIPYVMHKTVLWLKNINYRCFSMYQYPAFCKFVSLSLWIVLQCPQYVSHGVPENHKQKQNKPFYFTLIYVDPVSHLIDYGVNRDIPALLFIFIYFLLMYNNTTTTEHL